MKNLTKLISLSICGMLLIGCSNKAQITTTKTTDNNTKTTTQNTTDTTKTDTSTNNQATTTPSDNTSSTNDLSNLNADSKKIYDIIVAKYPTATLLTDDEKKLIDYYNNKYGWLHGYTAKSDDETKLQTTYINMLNLSTDYQKYAELITKKSEKQYIDAVKREIDRVLSTQKF